MSFHPLLYPKWALSKRRSPVKSRRFPRFWPQVAAGPPPATTAAPIETRKNGIPKGRVPLAGVQGAELPCERQRQEQRRRLAENAPDCKAEGTKGIGFERCFVERGRARRLICGDLEFGAQTPNSSSRGKEGPPAGMQDVKKPDPRAIHAPHPPKKQAPLSKSPHRLCQHSKRRRASSLSGALCRAP